MQASCFGSLGLPWWVYPNYILKTQWPFSGECHEIYLLLDVPSFPSGEHFLKNQVLSEKSDFKYSILAICSVASYAISPILSVSEQQGSRGEDRSGNQNQSH